MLPPDVPAILSYGPALPPFASGSISPFSASIRKDAAAQATDKKAERMNDRIRFIDDPDFIDYLKITVIPLGMTRSTSDVGVRRSFVFMPGISHSSVQSVNPASVSPSTSA